MYRKVVWPEKKAFAFTIFDDPDSQTFEGGKAIYAFLRDHDFRTTKGVWPNLPTAVPSDHGMTCSSNPDYDSWLREIQSAGFEIGFHNATSHTSRREQTLSGLDRFAALFGMILNPWPITTSRRRVFIGMKTDLRGSTAPCTRC